MVTTSLQVLNGGWTTNNPLIISDYRLQCSNMDLFKIDAPNRLLSGQVGEDSYSMKFRSYR